MNCTNPKCITHTMNPAPVIQKGATSCQFCGSVFQQPPSSFVENEQQALWKLRNYKRE